MSWSEHLPFACQKLFLVFSPVGFSKESTTTGKIRKDGLIFTRGLRQIWRLFVVRDGHGSLVERTHGQDSYGSHDHAKNQVGLWYLAPV